MSDDLRFVLAMTKLVSIIPKGLMNHMHICDYISYSKLCRKECFALLPRQL